MQPGIHTITNEEYHASEGISRSSIMEFKRSPYHYWYKYLNKSKNIHSIKQKETKNMKFGSALHTFILEGDKFSDKYSIKPDKRILGKLPSLKNVGREAYEMAKQNRDFLSQEQKRLQKEFENNSKGKIVLSQEEINTIVTMYKIIKANKDSIDLIIGAEYEKSIYWNDPDTGILCKVRPDIWHSEFVVDYKTTSDASESAFQRSVYSYGYYLQAAMTAEAFKHALNKELQAFIFLAQETTEPYLTAIYQLDQSAIDYGIEEFKKVLFEIKECRDSNNYPGYKTTMISLPTWSIKQ